ncbi:SOS response-associated peptidase [Halorientalis halophila]|uniref:SOS response-associated peptidase n=1 Tax=Halorientalis halophila TaxID=3108499 RepID=UPI0030093352
MCGRTSLFVDRDDLERRFDARIVADGGYEPRYNIAPGDGLEVIANDDAGEIRRFHWGLIPSWADEPETGMINARSETASEKPAFQKAWESRPCLVLSSGFYEWQARNGGPKRPYRIHREDDPAFAMAGLWEVWEGDGESEDETVSCVTILTTDPNELLAPIHDRMPVVLPANEESEWLEAGPDEREELCRPYPDDDLAAYEISTRVNNPGNDDPGVIEPLGHEQSGLGEFGSE